MLPTVLALAPACSAPDETAPPALGQAESALGDVGTVDWNNLFSYVGGLTNPNPNSTDPFCTGTLVTPRWVLTARHCFIDASHDVNDPIDIVLHPEPAQAPAGTRFSKSAGDDVMVRSTEANDELDDDEISRDIALVRLARPVRGFVTPPKHPSLQAGVCGDDWDGHPIGYGKGSMFCPDPDPANVRRFTMAENYAKSDEDYGAVYNNNSKSGGAIPTRATAMAIPVARSSKRVGRSFSAA